MKLINLDEFVVLSQGSEWLWTMISGLVLAVTFFAIYRQLSLQRDAAAVEQVRTIYRVWSDERMARAKLDVLVGIRDGAKLNVTLMAGTDVGDFWEGLAYLVRRLEGLAVMPALAVRAGEPGTAREILAELKAEPWARRLEPGPLGQAAVHELVQRRLGADADAEFCLACADATGGNPFMVHELITALSAAPKGQLPAPLAAIDAIEKGCKYPLDQGLRIESEAFAPLLGSPISRNLIAVFFMGCSRREAQNGLSPPMTRPRPPRIEPSSLPPPPVWGAAA